MPLRLRPTCPLARSAILVGDPGRALLLAQELLVDPKMSNHARGLWGYTSSTPAGEPLTVQSTGIGGPSAAVVLRDLAVLGVARAVRVGTCRALAPEVEPGAVVAVGSALVAAASSAAVASGQTADGRWRALDPPGGELARSVGAALPRAAAHGEEFRADAAVLSRDVDAAAESEAELAAAREGLPSPCQVADMQTGALFAAGRGHGVELAALLTVEWSESGERLDGEELERQVKLAGRIAAAGLSDSSKAGAAEAAAGARK